MKLVNTVVFVCGLFFLSACNHGNQNSNNNVTTPTSNPIYLYQTPAQAPFCLQGQMFQSQQDLCQHLRDGRDPRLQSCSLQERYMFFQQACTNFNWQGRDGDGDFDGDVQPGRPGSPVVPQPPQRPRLR